MAFCLNVTTSQKHVCRLELSLLVQRLKLLVEWAIKFKLESQQMKPVQTTM